MFLDRRLGLLLLAPATIFILLGFLLPVLILLSGAFQNPEGGWGLQSFVDFFAAGLNREVFWRTFRLGLWVTGISAVVGYAVALSIVDASDRAKGRLVATLVLPRRRATSTSCSSPSATTRSLSSRLSARSPVLA